MLSKDELLASILHECDVSTHLAGCVPEGGLDHAPAEGQRTNLECLRYLAFCAIGGATYLRDGNFDGYQAWQTKTAELGLDGFADAMEEQKTALVELFAGLSDDDLQRDVKHPLGHTLRMERALLELPLKWMVGYRMQLYLGLKSAGNTDIWTPDCWHGVSMPRDARPA